MEKEKRLLGTGSLRLIKSKRHPEGQWFVRYYDASGVQRTECTKTDVESKAAKFLAKRITEVAEGRLPITTRKVTVGDLATALFKSQKANVLRKVPQTAPESTKEWRADRANTVVAEAEARWKKHLEPVFGHKRAAHITKEDVEEYVHDRLKAKARNATINGEIALLRRAFNFGFHRRPRLVQDVPAWPEKLAAEERTDLCDDATFQKIHKAIKEPGLRAMCHVAFRLGFRKSELQNLLVLQVADGWISLFKGATKNGKARRVKLPDDLRTEVEACCAGKGPEGYVFTWQGGQRILDFRGAWAAATKAAGVKLTFHGLRRSCVKRMIDKGVHPLVGMTVTGHLTRTIFDKYAPTTKDDLQAVAKVL